MTDCTSSESRSHRTEDTGRGGVSNPRRNRTFVDLLTSASVPQADFGTTESNFTCPGSVIRPRGYSISFNAVLGETVLARIDRFANRKGELSVLSSPIRRMMSPGQTIYACR